MASNDVLKIRVVDLDGKPCAGISFGAMEINDEFYYASDFSRQLLEEILGTCETDSNGFLIWHSPPEKIRMMLHSAIGYVSPCFTISLKDGGTILPDGWGHVTPQLKKNGPNDFTLMIYPQFEVSGKVTDATTGEIIPAYKVFQAFKRGPEKVYWRQSRFGFVKNGHYVVNDDDEAEYFQIRIEAAGYKPLTSEKFDGKLRKSGIDFSLKKAVGAFQDGYYTVQTPDGKPAQNAYVSIATLNHNRQIPPISYGKPNEIPVADDTETQPYGTITNDDGQFLFPEIDFAKERIAFEEKSKRSSQEPMKSSPSFDFTMLILHDSGYALIQQEEFASLPKEEPIMLQKYAGYRSK